MFTGGFLLGLQLEIGEKGPEGGISFLANGHVFVPLPWPWNEKARVQALVLPPISCDLE